jgi:antitoxin HigA-1
MARSAIYPGEHLAEAIEAIGGTAAQLARDIGVPPNRVTGILHGTRGVTADTALRLGRYFGTSAAFWMNLQQIYDLRRAEQSLGDSLSRIRSRAAGGKGKTSRRRDAVQVLEGGPRLDGRFWKLGRRAADVNARFLITFATILGF